MSVERETIHLDDLDSILDVRRAKLVRLPAGGWSLEIDATIRDFLLDDGREVLFCRRVFRVGGGKQIGSKPYTRRKPAKEQSNADTE